MSENVSKLHFQGEVEFFGLGLSVWKLFIPSLAIVVVAIFSFVFVLAPKISFIPDAFSQISGFDQKIKEVNEKYQFLANTNEDDLAKQRSLVGKAIPEGKDIYFLLNLIGTIAVKYQYQIDTFSISPGEVQVEDPIVAEEQKKKTKQGSVAVPLSFTAIGREDNYLPFVKAMEEGLPVLSVARLDKSITNNVVTLKAIVIVNYSDPATFPKKANPPMADLKFSPADLDVLSRLEGFESFVEGATVGNVDNQSYVKYERSDPFN